MLQKLYFTTNDDKLNSYQTQSFMYDIRFLVWNIEAFRPHLIEI